jgi:hypothetical protein
MEFSGLEDDLPIWVNPLTIRTVQSVGGGSLTRISFGGSHTDDYFIIVQHPLETVIRRLAQVGHEEHV